MGGRVDFNRHGVLRQQRQAKAAAVEPGGTLSAERTVVDGKRAAAGQRHGTVGGGTVGERLAGCEQEQRQQ
ncbi:hypothetical protein D3C86_1907170 [compost metagenome]